MKRWFKTYLIVVPIMFIGGIIKSVIGGYRFLCDGWKSCDKYGKVIDLDTFISREIDALLLVSIGSIVITFFVLRWIDERKKENS